MDTPNWKVVVWDFEDGVSAIVEQPCRADDVPVALLPAKSKHDCLLLAAPGLLAACKEANAFLNDGLLDSECSPLKKNLRIQLRDAINAASGKVTGIDL